MAEHSLIIGGGIIGTAIAWQLARTGQQVTLVEKTHLGAGSTGKSGAILRQQYSNRVTIAMARESLHFFETFQAQTGQDIGFTKVGMVFVGNQHHRHNLQDNLDRQRAQGVHVDWLEREELLTYEPGGIFEPGDAGAFEHDAAYVDPQKTVLAFAAQAQKHGARILEGVGVEDLTTLDGRVDRVWLSDGSQLRVDHVINAAGPWAGKLLEQWGVSYPLRAVRPQQAYFKAATEETGWETIYADLNQGIYFKPEPAGWTRVGLLDSEEDEEVENPDNYDLGVTDAFIRKTGTKLGNRLSRFSPYVSWGGCGALYTLTPDAHPLVGLVKGYANLYIVSGFSGHGFKLAPSIGKGVASLITGSDSGAFEPELFDPDRFDRHESVSHQHAYGILG